MNLPEIGRTVRRGGAALAVAGTLALCAACGGGGGTEPAASPEAGATPAVSGEVQVTDEVAAAGTETPTATATPERQAPQARSVGQVRDPFVNPAAAGGAPVSAPSPTVAASPAPGAGGAAPAAGAAASRPAEPVVEKPDIKVTGIVRSGGAYRAILTGPENSYIVATGDKLGAYSVSSITATSVTITYKNHRFTLPLEQESFGSGGSRSGGSRSGGSTGAAPAPGGEAPGQ